jgi:HD-GYP domain-containing protein (c-di-GMP phosphodiesterase class II)
MNSRTTRRRPYPLHVHIATLFILLIVVMGLVLGWFNFRKNTELILSASEELFDRITQEVLAEFNGTYSPVASMVDLLSVSPAMQADTLEERLNALPLFREALNSKRELSALQVGYDTGDFFILRRTDNPDMRKRFEAPKEASFVADHITAGSSGTPLMLRLYFDAELKELERRELGKSEYDPRKRPWYARAIGSRGRVTSEPYLYYFIGKVGVTVGRRLPDRTGVVAADVTLEQLSQTLRGQQFSPSSELVLVSGDGKVLAYRETDRLVVRTDESDRVEMARIDQLGSPVLEELVRTAGIRPTNINFQFNEKLWVGAIREVPTAAAVTIYLAMAAPEEELLSEAMTIRRQSALITIGIIIIALPITWLLASRIAKPLRKLAGETDIIRNFDFAKPIHMRSLVKEIDDLAVAMDAMKGTISRFLNLITSLAGEQDFDRMLERVTEETMRAGEADGAVLYLVGDDEVELRPGCVRVAGSDAKIRAAALPVYRIDTNEVGNALVQSVREDKTTMFTLEQKQAEQGEQFAAIFDGLAAPLIRVIALPLHNRQREVSGCLCLLFVSQDGIEAAEPGREHIAFVEALSGFAAVSMETHHLLKMQKALLESFIKLIAGAIDAKSPYTGAHCQRVPYLTKMIARAACESQAPPFKDFDLSEEEWEALHIAGWMHDCGKVTTPEYVVDKATKLATIYDRIHEVRMRFEVLKRDAEIRHWQAVADGGDRDTLRQQMESEWRQLDEEFAFVAESNEGGEFMAPERIERLRQIAERVWMRTIDDRIGVSWEEKTRKERTPAPELPAEEKVLAEKEEHIIQRRTADHMPSDNRWGFRMDVPEHMYNQDEIYNLCVQRGTLTDEERYKINDHIVQTVIMLEKLPYPKHLRNVPVIAGGHHEKMDGTGYPRRLKRDDMPLTARMMAIADIFEALTAQDRPYKKAKKLSEAIRIMSFMKKDHHIDPEIFELFLTSGVYMEYARHFLARELIDEFDIEQYLDG